MCPQEESNLYYEIRNLVSYPLNDGRDTRYRISDVGYPKSDIRHPTSGLAHPRGLEPRSQAPQACVLSIATHRVVTLWVKRREL